MTNTIIRCHPRKKNRNVTCGSGKKYKKCCKILDDEKKSTPSAAASAAATTVVDHRSTTTMVCHHGSDEGHVVKATDYQNIFVEWFSVIDKIRTTERDMLQDFKTKYENVL